MPIVGTPMDHLHVLVNLALLETESHAKVYIPVRSEMKLSYWLEMTLFRKLTNRMDFISFWNNYRTVVTR